MDSWPPWLLVVVFEAVVVVAILWVAGLPLVQRASKGLPWHESGVAPGTAPAPSTKTTTGTEKTSTGRAALVFAASAVATLVAGVVLERTGDAAASQIGLSGILFGATVLALTASLPEISTGLQAIRQGDDNLAMSDIFCGNAFLPVLFLVASLLSGTAVLPRRTPATSTSPASPVPSPSSTSSGRSSGRGDGSSARESTRSSCSCCISSASSDCSPSPRSDRHAGR